MILLFLLFFLSFFYILPFKFYKKKYRHDYYFNFKRSFNKNFVKTIGDQNNLFCYLKYKYKNTLFCFSGLKIQGEEFTFKPEKHIFFFNSLTGYIILEKLKFNELNVEKIIIGNFKIGSGQGLVFNYENDLLYSPLDSIKVFKKQYGIKPCKSHKKRKFLGIGTQLAYKDTKLSIFITKNYLDAFLKDDKIYTAKIRERYINKMLLLRRNSVYNYTTGFSFMYKNRHNFNIGVNMCYSKFNKEFKLCNNSDFKESLISDMDNLLTGDNLINLSVFNSFSIARIKIYCEYARSFDLLQNILSKYGSALILGGRIRFSEVLKNVFLFRYYSSDYHNLYGNGFGSGKGLVYKNFKGCINNEIGVCNGLQIKLINNLVMKFVFDLCFIPKKTFSINNSYRSQFIFNLKYKFSMFEYVLFQCKYINSTSNIIVKNTTYFKNIYEVINIKTLFKKNIFFIMNSSNLTLSINPHADKCDFGICFYEKIRFNIWKFTNVLHFIMVKASEKSPVHFLKTVLCSYNRKIKVTKNNLFQIILNPKIKIFNKLIIDTMFSFKFIFNKNKTYQLSIAVRYIKN